MSTLFQRGIVRWKEWVPLVTQQQRLRNLIQIIAYNVRIPAEVEVVRTKSSNISYYYTLHLSTMSSPLYTSEKLESENPKWGEIEIDSPNGAANGIVLRLWVHGLSDTDRMITAWGLYFSGLVYIGTRLAGTDISILGPNTFVFHMHGGYFTGQHCFLDAHPVTPRTLTIQLNANQVKPSYSVSLLTRLHSLQQTVRKRTAASISLKEQIMAGCIDGERLINSSTNKGRESLVLRRLMHKPAPIRPHPQQILALRQEMELLKFRLELLTEEKERCSGTVKQLLQRKDEISNFNHSRSGNLAEMYCTLQRDVENCKEYRRQLVEVKSQLSHSLALLDIRKKELMSELSFIYPIKLESTGLYTIRGVHLPNSEDFYGKDELMISVALGFVAHLVQMMAYLLNVPTRYPICHFGSRSKIIDHIIDTIPDKDREFPLFFKGKEKLPFDYGVYLLNKNIAQLRWCCGLTTDDLRQTLQNLSALMTLDKKPQQSREWQRLRRDLHTEEEEDHPRQSSQQHSMCRSLEIGLERCLSLSTTLATTAASTLSTIPSRQTDSDPQDYLQTKEHIPTNGIVHHHALEKTIAEGNVGWSLPPPVEVLDNTNAKPIGNNCSLIISNKTVAEAGFCVPTDSSKESMFLD